MRYLIPVPPLTLDDTIRFWNWVIRKGEDDCWLWVGGSRTSCCPSPCFHLGDTGFIASRIAYAIGYGSVPSDKYVLHKCPVATNPLCMNPRHLYLGDQFDNMRDRFIEKPDSNRDWYLWDKRDELVTKFLAGTSMRQLARDYDTNYSRVRGIILNV